ncbi:MAG: DegV family protein [Anaerolineae bacterium]|nr:DegV family protein [Anaerolineae bacterium]
MAQIGIVVDSTASLPTAIYGRYGLIMVPYTVVIEGRSYRDLIDITSDEFNAYLTQLPDSGRLPTTANPSPGAYLEAYGAAAERASTIFSFHMASHASGAYGSACVARDMARDIWPHLEIVVIDTWNVSMCHGWIALQTARAAQEGASPADLKRLIRALIPATRMIQTADTLRYLYMGGRIGRAQHLVSGLLRIKPLISMEGGVITPLGVARTRERALRRIAELAHSAASGGAIRLALTHAAAEAEAAHLGRLVQASTDVVETLMCELCPVLTVHSGPGTVGLCYLLEDRPG